MIITCSVCGKEKSHLAKGMCKQCYHHCYEQTHKKERADSRRRWRQENPPAMIICSVCGQEEPRHAKGLCRACYNQRYYQEHKEEYYNEYREHGEEIRKRNREWGRRNRDKTRAYTAKRRSQKNNAYCDLSAEGLRQLMAKGKCFYCGAVVNLEYDHFIPLTSGGLTTKANGVVACRSCNARKHNKTPQEFLTQLTL